MNERNKVSMKASPTRCPYCHDGVSADTENVVCQNCLARHHRACWAETGCCSSCSGVDLLVPGRLEDRILVEETSPETKSESPFGVLAERVRVSNERPNRLLRYLITIVVTSLIYAPLIYFEVPGSVFVMIAVVVLFAVWWRRSDRKKGRVFPLLGQSKKRRWRC